MPSSSSPSTNENGSSRKSGTTTILPAGTVESRGIGDLQADAVHADIRAFLEGEAKASWKAETRAFFTVWMFLTRLPGPTWVDHHPGYLMRGMTYFPLGGLLVGVFVSVFYDAAHLVLGLPCRVAACASTAASFWVTGCFHEDGLADSADGIGGGWTRQQILTIMTDTRLGTYGSAVLMLYSVAKLELIASLGPSEFVLGACRGGGPALIAAHCTARCSAPYLLRTREYVEEMGPKYKFYSFMVQAKHLVSWERVGFALLTGFGLAVIFYGVALAAVLLMAVLLFSHCSGSYGTYLLGGVMGDYLGATICLTELLVLTMILAFQSAGWSVDLEDLVHLQALQHSAIQYSRDITTRFETMDIPVNSALGAFVRLVAVALVTKLWCDNVGYSPDFVRDAIAKTALDQKREESDTVNKNNSPTNPDDQRTFEERYQDALQYLDSLAKPVGSLGTLEDWAARLAALQGTLKPTVESAVCLIFAADHGAAKSLEEGGERCSAFPSVVTQSILHGLQRQIGGASVLGKQTDVTVRVLDVGVAGGYSAGKQHNDDDNTVVKSASNKLVDGTKNFCQEPAMQIDETKRCIQMGREALRQYQTESKSKGLVVALGEVGIGNTTSSAALIAALANADPTVVCGGGATTARTVDPAVIAKKVGIVKKALAKHHNTVILPYQHHHQNGNDAILGRGNPYTLDILAALGGAEIAAMVGCILEASDQEAFGNGTGGVPILMDGYIVTAAALVAAHMEPRACRIMFLATKSAEPGQAVAIASIQAVAMKHKVVVPPSPALDMNLRLGEGTGAIMAVPLLRNAAAVMNHMATLKDILLLEG